MNSTLAIIVGTVILVGLVLWAIRRNRDDDDGTSNGGSGGGSKPGAPKQPR